MARRSHTATYGYIHIYMHIQYIAVEAMPHSLLAPQAPFVLSKEEIMLPNIIMPLMSRSEPNIATPEVTRSQTDILEDPANQIWTTWEPNAKQELHPQPIERLCQQKAMSDVELRQQEEEGGGEVDLSTCSARGLARYLCQQRFHGEIPASVAFLQEALKELESSHSYGSTTTMMTNSPVVSSSSVRMEHSTTTTTTGIVPNHHQLGKPLLSQPLETSLLYPRAGKCSIQLYENGYLIATPLNQNKKDSSSSNAVAAVIPLVIPPQAVSHLIVFAKPEDYKTMANTASASAATHTSGKKTKTALPGAPLVLLKLRTVPDPLGGVVTFQGKPIKDQQVCFALSWVKGIGPTGPTTTTTTTDEQVGSCKEATDAWRRILERCLGHSKLTTCQVLPTPTTTASAVFSSYQLTSQSSTTGGMPFVTCYHGVQDGVLFPMREGLFFYKPPKFIPRSQLVQIACGRGSSGGSRYVDLTVDLDEGGGGGGVENQSQQQQQQQQQRQQIEFTNIHREELGVLNEYIHQVLIPAKKEDAANGGFISGDNKDPVVKTEDTEEEDDVEVEVEDDSDDDDDEDDENYGIEQEDEDGSGDKESGSDEEASDDDDDHDEEEDDDDDEFEVVDDDFAKELARTSKGVRHDEPRATRSSNKRRATSLTLHTFHDDSGDDDDAMVVNDDDFEVVEAEEDSTDDELHKVESPSKKSRHSNVI